MIKSVKYLFVPSNDSHVQWMEPIAKLLDDTLFMVIPSRKEHAPESLQNLEIPFIEYSPNFLSSIYPKIMIFGNDWNLEELLILTQAKLKNIFTVCVQEGSLIYPDSTKRLSNADCLFALGEKTREHFPHPYTILTGNPKFDQYERMPLPFDTKVMINLNFTYGVEERNRDAWLADVVSTLEKAGLNHFISAHPRQRVDDINVNSPIIRSNAYTTNSQLAQSTFLISRFSTMIYEAIAAGRKVIYYNPHDEPFVLFHGGYDDLIYETKSPGELEKAIEVILKNPCVEDSTWHKFMKYHLGTANRDSAVRCAKALKTLDTNMVQNNLDDLISTSYTMQLDTLDAKNWLAGQYETLTVEVERLNRLLEEKDRWLAELDEGKQWLAGQYETLTVEVDRLNGLLEEKDRNLDEIKAGKNRLEGEYELLRIEIENLKNELFKKENAIKTLELEIQKLQSMFYYIKSKIFKINRHS